MSIKMLVPNIYNLINSIWYQICENAAKSGSKVWNTEQKMITEKGTPALYDTTRGKVKDALQAA